MLNLLGKALSGVVLDRVARDYLREAGGLASAIQSSADARMIKAAMAAQGLQLMGSTPLTSPRVGAVGNPLPLAVRIARAAHASSSPASFAPALLPEPMAAPEPQARPAPMPAPSVDPADRIATSAEMQAKPRAPRSASPERAQLIENALKLHHAKQTVLSSLSADQRALLTSIAMKALFPQTTAG